ncbi:lipase, family member K [Monoraphidium neglectum]|uniref:Lipase, family member K n=1 Tax=Monoraphidium neglectum TaxID=145388 RepID=A0A0D2L7H6_9CHLO|nr:lipase, family member K [Monoraphidium neglectum]KIZ02804.1 lipase, family member K [Monoraphidium neglectum]|eukprot:XP_013901823.1 lipase, family member K [Monoraphidium neglectum]
MEDLVLPWGYPLESYPVETADGAVLRIYRIPYGVRNASRPGPRPAVLLHHGITLASSCFVVLDPESSMAFYLADAGFDVWMANTRGNTYSRGNRHYTQLEHGFWEFSMDELALLDLPSQIDFVLKTSGQKSLGFIGHSQGCTLSVMLLAAKPEYNKKIWLLMMLGAVTHVQYIAAPFLRQQVKTRSTQLFADMGVGEFAMNRVSNQVANGCKYEGVRSAFCSALINFAFYGSSTAVSPDDLVRVSVTWASGVATRNLLHWSQQYYANVSGLRMWDYGTECAKSPGFERKAFQESCNQAKYGTTTPPEYDLRQITAPAAIFQGDNDVMATVPDVDRLVREWRSKVVYREMWNDTA